MHEASIAQNVIDSVLRLIEDGVVVGKVAKVYLKVGKLTAVVPDNLQFMFEVLSGEGPLRGVKLEIEDVPIRARCGGCRAQFGMAEEVRLVCPECGSTDTHFESGRELLIDAVEVE
jgi:hydrogenase nickel incorporation protein HypA/HybF